VEIGETRGVLADPGHPYTRGLLRCRPRLSGPVQPVRPIPGAAPDPASLPAGCRFAARCSLADVACHVEPPLTELAAGRAVACHRPRGGLQERQ
ncbi:MAG: ABC transporter ATP-binding protein, partial [Deltaproteobacteria bacterium]|nr:ABC transporter ATP-binding protein [Deltaproteobacteria bacterium]